MASTSIIRAILGRRKWLKLRFRPLVPDDVQTASDSQCKNNWPAVSQRWSTKCPCLGCSIFSTSGPGQTWMRPRNKGCTLSKYEPIGMLLVAHDSIPSLPYMLRVRDHSCMRGKQLPLIRPGPCTYFRIDHRCRYRRKQISSDCSQTLLLASNGVSCVVLGITHTTHSHRSCVAPGPGTVAKLHLCAE